MVSAETVDGGTLKEAATKKADESIFIQIADKDLVALEVNTINVVMKSTHQFLGTAPVLNEGEMHECKYEESLNVCEEFVKEKLVKQRIYFT
jgi:hypothetical protein